MDADPRLANLLPNLRGTSRATALPDVVAGLTVAAVAVPQGMAYALVAGVPLELGLWAAALPATAAAFFGSSPYLVTGPTQPVALVLGLAVVAPAVAAGAPVPLAAVAQVALAAGLVLAGIGLLGLGGASRFLSDSVIAGLITGVGLLIALGQLPQLAGAALRPEAARGLVPQVWPLLAAARDALLGLDPRSAALGLGVPLVVVGMRRLDPRLPGGLLALGGSAALAWALGWTRGPGALPALVAGAFHWPSLALPDAPDPAAIGAPALAIALLVAVQSTAAARGLARASDPPPDPDREVLAQGVGNLVASLCGAIPTSGSFSRSALARAAGARSRLAPAVSGAAVLALLPVLAPLVGHVPLAALAGLVVLAGLDLIDPRRLRRAAATRGDAAVLGVTLLATLWLDVVQAVYAGLFLSLLLLVRRGGRLQMVEIVRAGRGRLREIPLDERTGTTPVAVLHLEGDLNFAVAPELAESLLQIAARGPRVLILRLKRARHLDATVVEALRRVALELDERGTTLILCGLNDALAALLERSELARVLGPDGLLRAGPRLMEGYERAVERARKLLAPAGDAELFREEQPAAWSFEASS